MNSLSHGSVEEFLEKLRGVFGRNYIRTLDKVLDNVIEPSHIIKDAENKEHPVIFRLKNSEFNCIASLIPSRRLLYFALGVKDDNEAYKLLVNSYNSSIASSRIRYEQFKDFFEEVELNVTRLPAIKFYENDGGFYIASSIIASCFKGICNASFHRMMVLGDNIFAVRLVPRHLYHMYKEAGESLPVAIVIGVNPIIELAASSSPPYGIFEIFLASQLVNGLTLCKTPTYNIPVPCGSSVVMEAMLTGKKAKEGPFVDLLLLYDAIREEPVAEVKKIYVNKVFPPYFRIILPGGREHKILMGFPKEAQIFYAVSHVVPTVHKVRLTEASGMWLHAIISIRKRHEGDGKNAGLAALSAHPSLKHVIVVDDDIDPEDPYQVEWAIATRFQADRDLVVISGARGSTLDPSSPNGLTSKMIIDATAPLNELTKYKRVG